MFACTLDENIRYIATELKDVCYLGLGAVPIVFSEIMQSFYIYCFPIHIEDKFSPKTAFSWTKQVTGSHVQVQQETYL